jgi:hypothetical protein
MRLSSANLQEIWQRRRTSGWELRGRPDELAGLKGVQEGKKKTEVIIRMMIDPMMRQKKQPAESGSLLRPSSPLVQLCAADAHPRPWGAENESPRYQLQVWLVSVTGGKISVTILCLLLVLEARRGVTPRQISCTTGLRSWWDN